MNKAEAAMIHRIDECKTAGMDHTTVRISDLELLLAEVEALRGLGAGGIDELLARWDKTDPFIQRGIVARLAGLAAEVKGRPMDQAPKDGTLFLAWAPGRDGLSAMYSLCEWHPDAGFCIDELRQPELWWELPAVSPIYNWPPTTPVFRCCQCDDVARVNPNDHGEWGCARCNGSSHSVSLNFYPG